MAVSLIKSLRFEEGDTGKPAVAGRIVTTIPKAKELRPIVEKLITLAKKAAVHTVNANAFRTTAVRNSDAWRAWRDSEAGKNWVNANAPVVALRREAFAQLRDEVAVDILFEDLAARFAGRAGGYTRVIRLSGFRLGDATQKAIIEFTGINDRPKRSRKRSAPSVVAQSATETAG